MEELKDWLIYSYPTADPFAGVQSITECLQKKHYVVVSDRDNPCYGILTSDDMLEHPHKLVIDCMSKKEVIQIDDPYEVIHKKFKQSSSEALPVYSEDGFVGVLEKTYTLIKYKDKIEEINKKFEGQSDLKESILHNLYHEVRTPLSHVLGFMNVLSEIDKNDLTNILKYEHIIRNGSRQLLEFMNELIDLSILNSGDSLNITLNEFFPESIFSNLITQFESDKDSETKTTVGFVKPKEKTMIVSDYKRLRQILSHLLDLSIHHSSVDSTILMGYGKLPDQEHIRFFIKNETALIDYEQWQIIKTSYQEENNLDLNSHSFSFDFAKKIAKLLHGSIDLEIDDQRKVCAYVTIPLRLTASEPGSGQSSSKQPFKNLYADQNPDL
jgi:K+-sensing histidine kinase KdpD